MELNRYQMEEDDQRLRAYLNLIDQLLDCPNGEETQVLQAHEELVDLGFVATTQRVGRIMEQRGDEGASSFLFELARQLTEQLQSPSRQRFDLLIRLLQTTEESHGEPASILTCLQESPELLDQEFLQIFQEWGEQILGQVEPQQAQVIAVVLGNFSNVLVNDLPLPDQAILRDVAITGYRFVLRVFTQESDPQRWAQTHSNLGQAFRHRILGERRENLDEAIEHLRCALSIRTPSDQPDAYERTQTRLEEVRQEQQALGSG